MGNHQIKRLTVNPIVIWASNHVSKYIEQGDREHCTRFYISQSLDFFNGFGVTKKTDCLVQCPPPPSYNIWYRVKVYLSLCKAKMIILCWCPLKILHSLDKFTMCAIIKFDKFPPLEHFWPCDALPLLAQVLMARQFLHILKSELYKGISKIINQGNFSSVELLNPQWK